MKKRLIWGILGLILIYLTLWMVPAGRAPEAKWLSQVPKLAVIAHGGGEGHGPRDTMEAAFIALSMGADVIELNLWASRDGHLVTIHDPTIDGTTNGEGVVSEMSLAELREFDAGYHFRNEAGEASFRGKGVRIPTLVSYFAAFPQALYVLEIKQAEPRIAGKLCKIIKAAGLEDRVLVGSFLVPELEAFRGACPEVATSLGEGEVKTYVFLDLIGLSNLVSLKASALQVPPKALGITILSKSFIEGAHARGLAVHAWTINDREEMAELVRMGIDGLITDFPDRAVKLRGDR
ncbi:MAG: glycerophosphodiester phosphodiesterase [Sphingomonadales bacterium]